MTSRETIHAERHEKKERYLEKAIGYRPYTQGWHACYDRDRSIRALIAKKICEPTA